MRILECNDRLYHHGGAERAFFLTADSLRDAGHVVGFFGMDDARNSVPVVGSKRARAIDFPSLMTEGSLWARIRHGVRIVHNAEASHALRSAIEEFRPDVVHFHNIAHHLSASLFHAVPRGVRLVQTLHDFKALCPASLAMVNGSACERCFQGSFLNAVGSRCKRGSRLMSMVVAAEAYVHSLRRSYQRADTFLAPSRFVLGKIRSSPLAGVPVHYVPYCIPRLDEIRPVYSGDYVLFLGRLSGEKGVHILIEAARQCPEIPFVVAGDGPLRPMLDAESRRLGNVTALGFLRGSELDSMLSASRFVVVPSLCYETAALAVYEAFSRGKAVVGSRIGAIPELVRDMITGILVPPNDPVRLAAAIRELWHAAGLATQYGSRAREMLQVEYSEDLFRSRLHAAVLGNPEPRSETALAVVPTGDYC